MNKITVGEDIIYNDYIKNDLTILHIADIHFNINTIEKKLNKIKERIYLINPDYVVITGDLIDYPQIISNKYKIKELLKFLTSIANRFKVIISLGNHDIFCENDLKFFNKLNDLKNIYVLNNDYYQDEFIFIGGLTLPTDYYYNITGEESTAILLNHINNTKQIIPRGKPTTPRILLVHSPIKILDPEVLHKIKDYDLLLSGHMHGGMIPTLLGKIIKGNGGIIAPNKKLHPSIARGRVDRYVNNKKITLIITSGVTKLSLRSSKLLSKLNFFYNISINKITITKKYGK